MTITVADLKNSYPTHPSPVLRCDDCGATYSAHAGDYFASPPDHAFLCCEIPMRLVVERITYQEICLHTTYEFSRYCGVQTCDDCGDHLGLTRCYCGWSRSGGNGRQELVELGETLDEEE